MSLYFDLELEAFVKQFVEERLIQLGAEKGVSMHF